jgi:VanZ family protein
VSTGLESTSGVADVSPQQVVAAWLLVALWTGFVWWLGSAAFSASVTSRFLAPLVRWLWSTASPEQVVALVLTLRKIAHPFVYGVLAALCFRATRLSGAARPWIALGIALCVAVAVASLDETRQATLVARTGSPVDVALDAAGALTALGAALLWARRRTAGARWPS